MGERATTRGLSYQVRSLRKPGVTAFRPYACASCHVCGALHEIRLTGTNNPEAIEKKFRADRWEFDAWNARRVTCAGCVAKRNAGRHGESGRKEGENVVKLSLPNKTPVAATAVVAVATAAASQGGALPPNKTDLTVEERARVRDMLGGSFDERIGQYLEGWSDIRVAKEAGDLPPKLVADLREVAYGPLKSVSDLDMLRAELVVMEKRFVDELARMRDRISATAQALGVRA